MGTSQFFRPYQIFFEHRPGYLYAYIHSEINSYEIARGYWTEMLTMLHSRHYERLFIEKDIPQRLAPHEVFDLVSNLAHSDSSEVHFAIFDHYFDAEKCRFEQTVGTNRRLNLRIERDRQSLERWLVSQPFSEPHSHLFPLVAGRTQPPRRWRSGRDQTGLAA